MEIEALLAFLSAAETDPRISTAHVSLFVSLFSEGYKTQCDAVSFSRPQLMSSAKISSRATYHKCMKDLHDFGYVKYIPSHHPVLGSLVLLDWAGKSTAT